MVGVGVNPFAAAGAGCGHFDEAKIRRASDGKFANKDAQRESVEDAEEHARVLASITDWRDHGRPH